MEKRANPVSNEILRLKRILFDELKLKTKNAAIGVTYVSLPPEQELAQKMLVEGRPKAFVEFFEITNTLRPIPTNKEDDEAGILNPVAEAQKTLKKKEVLSVLFSHLVAAEYGARTGNNEKLFLALSGAGTLFDETCYLETSLSYYLRSLAAAINVENTRNTCYIAEAKYNLGRVYWKMQNSADAINSFEECLALARFINDGQRIILASKNLLEVYWTCAERSRRAGCLERSILYFDKCVTMATYCREDATGGEAKYNIGVLYGQLKETEKAVNAQNKYLEFCKGSKDKAGECKAHASLSDIFEASGSFTNAVQHMQAFIEASADTDLETQARGQCLFGMLYKRANEQELSLQHLNKYFEISRIIKNPDLLDVARVNIGIVENSGGHHLSLILGCDHNAS